MLDPAAVYVCVATYNRNDQLAALLASLRELDSDAPQVIVVDNNPEPLAEETVTNGFPGSTYIHQPQPGIATARNAALDALPEDAQAVIFVDDDERVHPGWLTALLGCADSSGADVVYGPVLSVLPEDPPEWLKRWELDGPGYIRRVDFETGPWDRRPATNNSLVRAEWFTERGLRFDEAFNFTGGSDSDLFQTMIDAGAVIWWCAEAVVEEDVPPSRVTKAWLRQRQQRLGHMRVMQKSKRGRGRASLFLEGTARIGFGLTLWPRRWLTRQRVSYSDRGYLRQGIGMVKATVGLTYEEYARRDSSPRA
ncbi:glycosyltransferase family 2 protein [Nesterenkonia sp. MY13]|uniref:Glycosyltransferase family 2 protein n=1 Tax=Nesterenkonia sedimenti TaxID=1463632 RepID=A0A7X8YCG5_9MICC|nr:glycosyltransferase family 2 protein [Nesterenkonia sedimenti]NLS08544.1 glycosyltransferase family 2 protein [Nesterenkonia sedimenti]